MRSKTQEKVLRVLLKALKPLVHLLLEVGIGHREFSEIAKRAFVDVATQKYGIRGRKTNISRVAVMTGLTRKEVKRIRDFEEDAPDERLKPIPASTVLHHWHNDPEFQTERGLPRELPFDSSSGETVSFTTLVKKYAGDIPPGALRTEMQRSGAVELGQGGLLKAVRRDFRVVNNVDLLVRAIERPFFNLMLNIQHNNSGDVRQQHVPSWPESIMEIPQIDSKYVPRIVEMISADAMSTLEDIDTRVGAYSREQSSDQVADAEGSTVSFGYYLTVR